MLHVTGAEGEDQHHRVLSFDVKNVCPGKIRLRNACVSPHKVIVRLILSRAGESRAHRASFADDECFQIL